MRPVLGLVIAYVCGSIPFAYLAARLLKGVDLRTIGSGNLGATNVYRTLGLPAAIVVLVLDALKGALPVFFLPRLLVPGLGGDATAWWALAYGAAAIAGHAKPLFLLWNGGGKGVATAGGIFAVLAPWPALAATVLLFGVVLSTRYMSLGSSVTAALVFPVFVWISNARVPVFVAALGTSVFILWTHRANLRRLRDGSEHRLTGRVGKPT